jgi:hypothetical protein
MSVNEENLKRYPKGVVLAISGNSQTLINVEQSSSVCIYKPESIKNTLYQRLKYSKRSLMNSGRTEKPQI